MMKNTLIVTAALVLLSSCNVKKPSESGTAESTEPVYALTEVWHTDTLLRTCESVLFDAKQEVLFVACINGDPSAKDGNGFIAMLNPDGSVKALEWVTGLDAPKGMGMMDGRLYVTNIDQLVIIDMATAEVIEKIQVEGASFLNDIDVGADGVVYFTDSDTGIVWIYEDGTVKPWITEGLSRPNGLYVEDTRVMLTSSGSEALKIIDKSTGAVETVTEHIGHGDGVEFTGKKGYYLTSSWDGEVFLILPDYTGVSLLKTSDNGINSADIGFNMKEQMVYVPTFFDNRVVAYKLTIE